MTEKLQKLENLIRGWERVVVGFSAGVDSTLVAYVASKTLGSDALIVLAETETITSEDVGLAKTLAKDYGFNFREISYRELEIENYAANPVNRCYFCKHELYQRLGAIAAETRIPYVLDGANMDDVGDYRPGRIAAKEFQVRSPLIEALFTKADVREAAKFYGLPNHEKPSAPCLSSRIPYGIAIDLKSLDMIGRAERYIREMGFKNVRVRHFQTTAKIEVDDWAIPQLHEKYEAVQGFLKTLGYAEVLIDEEGFKSGKLNRGVLN